MQLTSIVHILSPETYKWPSWISGMERMTIVNISWSISTKECCHSGRGRTGNFLITSWTRFQLSHRSQLHLGLLVILTPRYLIYLKILYLPVCMQYWSVLPSPLPRQILDDIFLIFSHKTGFETTCMKCQILFIGKIQKILQNVTCWKFYWVLSTFCINPFI